MPTVLTPAEERGLRGLSLDSRVRQVFYSLPHETLAALSARIPQEALKRQLIYYRDGQPEAINVMLRPTGAMPDQVAYCHVVSLALPPGYGFEWTATALQEKTASGQTGIVLGLVFGLPSLRLRGLYLAVSTLALHFIVIYLGGEYETKRGFSTGIIIDPPAIGEVRLSGGRAWYFVLLGFAVASLLICINLLRSRSGRAWRALHARETVAETLGISIAGYKLLAFVISSGMTSIAGCLFAYYRGFVSIEAFDLFLSIQYVAMIIIGGMGSLLGALLGAPFVTVFPYVIESLIKLLPNVQKLAGDIFAVNYASFGVVMILFLVLEPLGLVGIWHRLQNYFLLWPFKQRPLASARK